jgi:hypothetical protein
VVNGAAHGPGAERRPRGAAHGPGRKVVRAGVAGARAGFVRHRPFRTRTTDVAAPLLLVAALGGCSGAGGAEGETGGAARVEEGTRPPLEAAGAIRSADAAATDGPHGPGATPPADANGANGATPPADANRANGAAPRGAVARPEGSAALAPRDEAPAAAPPVPRAWPAPQRPLRRDTRDELLALFDPLLAPAAPDARERAAGLLLRTVGPGSPARVNQGNAALARHAVDAASCRRGLEGVTLQTPEQRAICGAENMVPLFRGGRAEGAAACIDVFEFPNAACELPLVWASPTQAQGLCEAAGKRLCSQDEWQLACAGDPAGGPDRRYAYGDELDLEACNTNKPAAAPGAPPCDADTARSAWRTCRTETEPAGAFPRCRSRFGAFDLHGNVAEIMTRRDETGRLVSQLKGSAFFYVDVARAHDAPRPPRGARETYPDHCGYDPRWHVEPMTGAWHVNYHLGFRCCKTVAPVASGPATSAPPSRPRARRARAKR